MDCQIINAQVGAFLDGELSASDSLAMRNHLRECESCSELCNNQKLVDQSLRTAVLTTAINTDALRNRVRRTLSAQGTVLGLRSLQWVGVGAVMIALLSVGL